MHHSGISSTIGQFTPTHKVRFCAFSLYIPPVSTRHISMSIRSFCCTIWFSLLCRSLRSEVGHYQFVQENLTLAYQSTAFDQDINAKAALAFPQLYLRGIRGLDYTRTKFWLYMGDGLYQSVVMFFIPFFAWSLGPAISWNGKGIDSLADFGTTVAVVAIISANTYVGLNTH